MITERVKGTKSYQAARGLPTSIWSVIILLAKNNHVDLNSVEYIPNVGYLIGEPRTKLTIIANKNYAELISKEGLFLLL